MKQKLLFVILASTIIFFALTGAVQANLLLNCSFEDTANPYGDVATDWGDWDGTSGYYEVVSDGMAVDGDKYMHMDCTVGIWAVLFQHNRPASPGDEVWIQGWVRDSGVVTTVGLQFEYYDDFIEMDPCDPTNTKCSKGGCTDPYPIAFIFAHFDTAGTGDWEWFSDVTTAPADTVTFTPVFVTMDEDSSGNWRTAGYDLDALWANIYPNPYPETCWPFCCIVGDPEPYDNQEGVSTSITRLSWKRASYDDGRQVKVEVWWGEQDDPNFWYVPGEAKKLMDLKDANYIDLSSTLIGNLTGLEEDKYYYWKLRYEDPNGGNFGAGLLEASAWSFETSPVFDINGSGSVDLGDFGILSSQWQGVPGTPSADIAPAGGDNFVDMQDLKILAENWLWP